mmetsp:Transcript_8227/g.14966  ORF Transcript_8227/g.14966 Transcript_8227/m.14966 type:complete len:315 (-) Transcript_8227:50-994(-)
MLGQSVLWDPTVWAISVIIGVTHFAFPDPSPIVASQFDVLLSNFSELLRPFATFAHLNLDKLVWASSNVILLEVSFWSTLLMYHFFDHFQLFQKYKLHSGSPDPQMVRECLYDVLLGHFLVRPVLLYFSMPLFANSGWLLGSNIPNFLSLLKELFICIMIDDTVFYWVHRSLHHPLIYKHIHKQHHAFKQPIALATEYSHPIEDFSNTFATVLGPLLLKSHSVVFYTYTTLKLVQSLDAHSSYNLPFSPFSFIETMDCAPAHDFHHTHNAGNFGGFFIFWDWLCGTDQRYMLHLEKNKTNPAYFNVVKSVSQPL